MQDSIFTKIIKGEIPSYKVYEDDKTFAFLDIHPLLPGHVLVIPKLQIDHVDELPPEDYQALFLTVQKVAQRVKTVLGAQRATVHIMGFDVPHAHVHVVPANSGKEFTTAFTKHAANEPFYTPDEAELTDMARKLAF